MQVADERLQGGQISVEKSDEAHQDQEADEVDDRVEEPGQSESPLSQSDFGAVYEDVGVGTDQVECAFAGVQASVEMVDEAAQYSQQAAEMIAEEPAIKADLDDADEKFEESKSRKKKKKKAKTQRVRGEITSTPNKENDPDQKSPRRSSIKTKTKSDNSDKNVSFGPDVKPTKPEKVDATTTADIREVCIIQKPARKMTTRSRSRQRA